MIVKVIIDNPSDDLLDALECVVKLDPQAKMTTEYPDEEYLLPEVEAEYDEMDKELAEQRKNGTARYYRNREEFEAAMNEIQDTDYDQIRKVS